MVSEGLCQVLWVFYLRFISNDTFYFMYFAIALNTVAAIGGYFIPESPRYLYGINNLDKCAEVFTYIAKMNGVANYESPTFKVDFEIAVEDVDHTGSDGRITAAAKIDMSADAQDNFKSLLGRETDVKGSEARGDDTDVKR